MKYLLTRTVFNTIPGAKSNEVAYRAFHSALAKSDRFRGRDIGWRLISDRSEARKVARQADAVSANIGPAGSCHPHRLTTALLRLALESTSCQLFSWAPVLKLEQKGEGWNLDCGSRGTISAGQVVCATNAWTKHLFPESTNGEGIGAQ